MPETPCGKCTACPCSSKKENRPIEQQPQKSSPKVDCQCASRRNSRSATAPVQAPLADTITCTRPRPEPVRQVPPEERCTCRIKPVEVQCECQPTKEASEYAQETKPAPPPTHQTVVCGRQPARDNRPQYTPAAAAQCGHCREQRKKKKCVIQ